MTLMLIVLAIMLAVGLPIGVALAAAGVVYLVFSGQAFLVSILAPRMFSAMNSFELLAIPLFVVSGDIMFQGRVSKSLVDLARIFVGRFKGSLAMVTTLACMFFGAVSGSGPATASAIGSIVAPEMDKEGYPPAFTAAIIAASGPLGVLIPPSILMVVYGGATETSVGKLLLGGVGPGILFGLFIMAYSWYACTRRGFGVPSSEKLTLKALAKSLKDAGWALLTPLIILGGIYSGIFTPTEAAAAATVYSLFLVLVVYRSLSLRDLPKIFATSAVTSAAIMFVVGAVGVFGWVLAREQIPQRLTQAALSSSTSPLTFLVIVNVVLFIAGMLMNGSAAILLLAPLFIPIVRLMKIDPVFMGVMVVANLCIGMVTPPVAVTLYVATRICKARMADVIRETIPLVFVMLAALAVLVAFPSIATFLPSVFFK